MSKKKLNKRRSQENSGTLAVVIIVVVALVIGGGTVLGLMSGNGSGGGTNSDLTSGQSTGSLESQVAALAEQVKNNPKDAALHETLGTALFNLANAYQQSNDPRTAETFNKTIEAYNKTLELNPNSKETLGDLATAYFYSNQTDLAISTVQKALQIDPAFAPALMNYSIYLANGKGDYSGALEQLQKVPSGSPQYSQAQSLMQEFKQEAAAKK